MIKKRIKAVIFDFDGTLVNTEHFFVEALKMSAKHFNIMLEEKFTFSVGHSEEYLLKGLKERYGDIPTNFLDKSRSMFFDILTTDKLLMPDVTKTLKRLKSMNVKMAIGSNSSIYYIAKIAESVGLDNYIDHLSSYDIVKHAKPSPHIFLNALRLLDVSIDEVIIIEDTKVGVEAGHNAGITTVAVTNTQSREDLKNADIIIDKIDEIFNYFEFE